jgi:hypothetical protein
MRSRCFPGPLEADVLHTVKATANRIRENGGEFVLPVKENRRTLFDALDALPSEQVPVRSPRHRQGTRPDQHPDHPGPARTRGPAVPARQLRPGAVVNRVSSLNPSPCFIDPLAYRRREILLSMEWEGRFGNNCWPLGQSPRFVVISPDAKYAFVSGHSTTGVVTPSCSRPAPRSRRSRSEATPSTSSWPRAARPPTWSASIPERSPRSTPRPPRPATRSRSRAPRPIPVQGAPSYIAIKAGSVAS